MPQLEHSPLDFLEEAQKQHNQQELEYWGYPQYYKKYPDVFKKFFNQRYGRISNHLTANGKWLVVG